MLECPQRRQRRDRRRQRIPNLCRGKGEGAIAITHHQMVQYCIQPHCQATIGYRAEDCQLLTNIGRRSLRSADVLTCATKRTQTRLGERSFSVAGPCLWNSLLLALCDRGISLVQFKRLLKTLWFVWAAAHSDCCVFAPCTNILTYLLTYINRSDLMLADQSVTGWNSLHSNQIITTQMNSSATQGQYTGCGSMEAIVACRNDYCTDDDNSK